MVGACSDTLKFGCGRHCVKQCRCWHSTGGTVCAMAAKTARPHRLHPPRGGTAAFDVIYLTGCGPFMMLAAARAAGKVFVLAEQVRLRQ